MQELTTPELDPAEVAASLDNDLAELLGYVVQHGEWHEDVLDYEVGRLVDLELVRAEGKPEEDEDYVSQRYVPTDLGCTVAAELEAAQEPRK